MKKLNDRDLVVMIREEWEHKVSSLFEGLSTSVYKKGEKQPLLAPELKLIHTKSGIRYTVDSVSMRDVVLRNPEGEKFRVPAEELESEYEIA